MPLQTKAYTIVCDSLAPFSDLVSLVALDNSSEWYCLYCNMFRVQCMENSLRSPKVCYIGKLGMHCDIGIGRVWSETIKKCG